MLWNALIIFAVSSRLTQLTVIECVCYTFNGYPVVTLGAHHHINNDFFSTESKFARNQIRYHHDKKC